MRWSDILRLRDFDYNWRRILPRFLRKAMLGAVLMLGMITFYTVLEVHAAVAGGALNTPGFGCIDQAHSDSRESLVDRSFARSVAAHRRAQSGGSGAWHIERALALLGGKLAFSSEERKSMVLPSLEALPLCPARE